MPYAIIFPPGNKNGHPTRWYWEIVNAVAEGACGTSPDRSEAFECAELAMGQAMVTA